MFCSVQSGAVLQPSFFSFVGFVLAFDDAYALPLHLRRRLVMFLPAVCLAAYVQHNCKILLFLSFYVSAGFEGVYSIVRLSVGVYKLPIFFD